ncbi:GNAT family N-acetyltransferase [Tritonibacter horizontis]|uniref:Acetyltransferase (GNAT) family protein n=1 Tax=Tritonibacter horizontis TaxID=1768241 RepID=A0A132BVB1_9RHOB|nr:GNAT family N-acetyltransferase [Tritonibacter horizontis]KUP91670.1 acetyltransferase (GNAT) family protein [Tritonibacter horizontis]
MVWRAATEADVARALPFLDAHIQSSMFLLENLSQHGLGSDHPNGLTLWVPESGDGIFGITNSGTVLMQRPAATSRDWLAAGQLLAGRDVNGVLGDALQVRAFIGANGLGDHPCQLDSDDPGFVLDLADLKVEMRAEEALISVRDAPRALMDTWRTAYEIEAVQASPEKARIKGPKDIDQFIARDSHRVLLVDGVPVAMCGYNTTFENTVQVGGVYTPPALRGRGYARRVVGRHMAECRARGVSQAVLFAASAAAAKAYVAVGFRPAGTFALVLFSQPAHIRTETVEGCT